MAPNLRRIFMWDGEDDESKLHDFADALDEQEQEELIDRLIRDNIMKNEQYCKIIAIIAAIPVLFFVARIYWMGLNILDLLCLLSIFITFANLPAVDLAGGVSETGSRKSQTLNLLLSSLILIYTIAIHFFENEYTPEPGRRLSITEAVSGLPFLVATINALGKSIMNNINFQDLDQQKYLYKGA